MVAHTQAQDLFGRSEMILLAVKTPEVFDIPFLERFARLHKILSASLPHPSSIDSLTNAQLTHSIDARLFVEDPLPSTPTSLEV